MRDRNAYANLREGLVGAWIPSVSGSGLLLPDLSGQGNNGALTNMDASDWVSSQYGRALDFDGVNDYVIIKHNNNLNAATQLSVSAWIKIGVVKANNYILSKHGVVSNENLASYGISATDETSKYLKFYIAKASSLSIAYWDALALNDTSSWHHVCAALKGTSVTAYVDGISEGPQAISEPIDANIGDLLIGFFGRASTYFNGQLDDIRIYNRVLSESEIKLLASRPGIGLRPQRRTMYYAPPTGARRRRILTSMP